MYDRLLVKSSFLHHGCILLILLWFWGCSSMGPSSIPKQWSCDADADAAVARQEWDQARRRHQGVLEKEPGNCLAIYHLGYIWGKLGNREAEVTHYERAVRCGYTEDDHLFFNLGMAYGELDLMQEALDAFEKAAGLSPQNADNHFGLGMTAQAAGLTDKALTELAEAVRIDPRHWEARIALTRIYLDQGQMEAAGLQLEALSKGVPEDPEVADLLKIYEDRRISAYDR
ncbi:MAG: tetratricopeptide repeat protein [Desulfobacteraceae bacterium]|jgi:tetratricopeptide (TPR) repeat protein